MTATDADFHYVAYIDESGDPGLNKIRPDDPEGSSEWLVVSAVIVRRDYTDHTDHWIDELRRSFINFKARDIHFGKLTERNKTIACQHIARRPVTIFAVCSNKKNMKGYNNPFAALRSLDRNWYYCWLTRVLLERVTYFINHHTELENGVKQRRVKLIFSNRGGLSYSQMKAYFELIKLQGGVGGLCLDMGQVYFKAIHSPSTEILPHWTNSGLKLADISASAFFRGIDLYNTRDLNPSYAMALKPRVASIDYTSEGDFEAYTTYAGYGVKLLPSYRGAKLRHEQQELFKFYGYPRQWWDPTPPTSSPFRLATVANRNLERHE